MANNTNDWNMKWLTSFQDNLAEAQYLTRLYKRNGKPTEEQFKEIKLAEHNAREALTYWSSDINAGWTQLGHSEMPLKVQQYKEYLDTGSSAIDDE